MHMRQLRQKVGTNWLLWVVHLSIYLIVLGVIVSRGNVYRGVLVIVLLGWMGLLILHFLVLGSSAVSEKHKHDDKPKRTETCFALGDDGELIALNDEINEQPLPRNK
jgi:hypothetical protein